MLRPHPNPPHPTSHPTSHSAPPHTPPLTSPLPSPPLPSPPHHHSPSRAAMMPCPMLLLVLACAPSVWGHGALISPPSRNAIDRLLPAFDGGRWPKGSAGCNCGSPTGCEVGARAGGNGQPCLWFSQGCTIGCSTCDNATQHTMGKSLCNSTVQPTLPKYAWTLNRNVTPGSPSDTYRHHPWRAPGTAPVVDACGMAGGAARPGGGEAVFAATHFAKQGDLGSQVLPVRFAIAELLLVLVQCRAVCVPGGSLRDEIFFFC